MHTGYKKKKIHFQDDPASPEWEMNGYKKEISSMQEQMWSMKCYRETHDCSSHILWEAGKLYLQFEMNRMHMKQYTNLFLPSC